MEEEETDLDSTGRHLFERGAREGPGEDGSVWPGKRRRHCRKKFSLETGRTSAAGMVEVCV